MKIRFVVPFCCLILVCGLAWSEEPPSEKERSPVPENINEKFLDPNADAEEWVGRFETESREVFANREEIVKSLGLEPGDRIADIGAGTGLFSALFAEAVGKEGKVYAVDISPTLIQFMKTRFRGEKWDQVEVVFSKEDSVELPEASVDAVYICDTYHHFEYHQSTLASIFQALAPGGELFVIDFERIPGESREWILGHVRAGKDDFRSEIEKAGFEFKEQIDLPGLEENYFLRFEKPQTP